jgi:tetratricopeptide (TPR) repeat protein
MLAAMKSRMDRSMKRIVRSTALACALGASLCGSLAYAQVTQVNDRAIVMGILAAEFALQEGDIATAATTYAEVARRSQDAKVAERAVELLLRSRLIDEAKDVVAIWQKNDSGSVRANQIALAIALTSNDQTLAMKSVSRVTELPVDKQAGAIMDLARQLAQHKDRDFAVKLASIFTETLPALAESHYALSVASTGTDGSRISEAMFAIDKALAIKPNWPQAVALKARLIATRADKATSPGARALAGGESVKLLKDGVAANPESRDLRQLLARMQFDLGEFKEARAHFVDLADDGKEDAEEMQLAATLAAFSAQDWETAEREFGEALASEKGDANALRYYLGRVAEAQKKWSAAAERYSQVQRVGQGDRYWESQLRIAGVLASDKRVLQAMSHLKQMTPTTAFERVTLAQTEANLWRDAGEHKKAFDALDAALKADADNTDLLYESAMLAERIDRIDDAEKRLRRVMELEPKRAHAYNALGYSFADRNVRLDEARTLIEKGYELQPDDAAIIDSMGWIAFRQGKLKEAEDYLRRAYGKFKDGEIAAHLGEVLWAQGRKDEARTLWRDQLKAQPDSDILKKTMQRLDPQ